MFVFILVVRFLLIIYYVFFFYFILYIYYYLFFPYGMGLGLRIGFSTGIGDGLEALIRKNTRVFGGNWALKSLLARVIGKYFDLVGGGGGEM